MVVTQEFHLSTEGYCDIRNITEAVAAAVQASGLNQGIATVFTPSATSAITTVEYESGMLADFEDFFERVAAQAWEYKHNQRWHDGNGFSHVRAALLGPSLSVPFTNKRLMLGTWQQIVFIDFDNRRRSRKVIIQLIGD
ncbi:MAG: secondary thiamine-phosphate synthase enzyme YjbQ [Anaerolineae bacterium]|nr:secondary thiamine-phosphate synthase enzyme YjbQ [Anaerolineae bacterium]